MNRLIVIVLVTVACANAVFAQKQVSINPASIYQLGGMTVVSPNQPGWVLLQPDKSLIGFEKRGEGEVLNAFVKTIGTKVFNNDNDLLTSLEALKVEELSKLTKVSVHFNYVRFKATPCVQYDGIFTGDTSAPNFEYLNFKGYLCRYPESKDLVVQIELSNHSNLRGFSENLNDLSNEFFEKLAFSKVAANPTDVLRSAQTIFIRTKSVYFKPAALEQALLDRDEVQQWGFVISREESDADLIIEVDRKLFTNRFVYSVIDPHTKRVLLAGKIGSLGGTVEGQIADGFIKRLKRVRPLASAGPAK